MRRSLLLGVSLLLAGSVLGGAASPVAAQQGVSVEVLGQGLPPEANGLQLTLLRATFAPEGQLAPHRHPGALLLYIEAGALEYTMMDGVAEIVRAGTAAGTAPPELLTAGQGTVLNVGDQLLERGVIHAAANSGMEPTVVLISAVLQPGQPVTQLVAGTP
jgi:quercetin dioxygenase-like cupin family protein